MAAVVFKVNLFSTNPKGLIDTCDDDSDEYC
jgi:hypothetical protein